MKLLVRFCSILLFMGPLFGQTAKENNLIADGNEFQQEQAYIQSEASYRKALSVNNKNVKAQHNLGNALYRSKDFDQANQRFFITQKNSLSKTDKHLAFHNMGNGYMQQKEYEKAVEAYKNALRNNPSDDTTRYNYALAKKLLEKEKEEQQDDQQQQDNQENQNDQNDQNQEDQEKDGDQKDPSDDKGDKGDDKNENGENENNDQDDQKDQDKQDQDKENKSKEKNDKQQQPPQKPNRKPGQISPEQVKSLLEAMNQQEKKVQDKVNAKKAKGVPVKAKKDW